MRNLLLFFLLAGALSAPAFAALQEGEAAPGFEAQASLAGKAFGYSLQDALKKGPVVVYFYPSAYTGGCNIQAHTFAENYDKFEAAGATIVGVSLDNIARLNDFSADPQYCAGKIAVASDAEGRIAKAYDVNVRAASADKKDTRGVEIGHGYAERTTFVIGRDGKIAAVLAGLKPAEHVEQALAVVRGLCARER